MTRAVLAVRLLGVTSEALIVAPCAEVAEVFTRVVSNAARPRTPFRR